MKFRKIYWVTEQLRESGCSMIGGVYTSVNDLVSRGLCWKEGLEARSGFRVTLVQLDSTGPPLGSWEGPGFDGMEDGLAPYVKSQEMTEPEVEELARALRSMSPAQA